MSKVKSTLASLILKEHFGDIVKKLGSYLVQNGRKTLRDLLKVPGFDKEEVKKSLSVLLQHNIVTFAKNKRGEVEYHVELDQILLRRRFQKYVYCSKVKFGDVAELVVETFLLNGCDILSRVAQRVADRLALDGDADSKIDTDFVVQKCKELILGRFLWRVKIPKDPEETEGNDKEKVEEDDNQAFIVPQGVGVKRKATETQNPTSSKKWKRDDGTSDNVEDNIQYEDDGIYWCLNTDRFDQYFLDQLIVGSIADRIDQSASKIASTMLKMTEKDRTSSASMTTSISIYDIIKKLPNTPKMDFSEVQQYMTLLSDEKTGGFLTKTDEASGGMYAVKMFKPYLVKNNDIKESLNRICQSACATIVQERFGSKACRVFRLLLQKKYLEQKQIGELSMIPFKDVKELLYKLFEERMVKTQEITKTNDYAPSRTFYLFSVDLPQVSRLLINRSFQAIGNMMIRRESEEEENKRLLEKNEKIEGILSALSGSTEETEQVMVELEELITPTEKQQLEKLKVDLARLEQGEIQVEDTIFILQNYLRFH